MVPLVARARYTMSTFSAIGAGVVGAIVAIAGIVTVETRPPTPSAIVICENYVPLPDEELLAVRGCRLDGRTVRVIVANPSELQAP
jgi:hypothetical protein